MKQKTILLILCVSLCVAFSCSEELKPTPYSYTKVFTGENNKTWKIKLFEETLRDTVIGRSLPNCLADDTFVFFANAEHRYETTSGPRQCFEDEAGLTESNWSFSNSTATLVVLIPFLSDDALPFYVREADDDDMIIEIFLDEENTQSYRIHFSAIDEE
jgi:hypothetical protein